MITTLVLLLASSLSATEERFFERTPGLDVQISREASATAKTIKEWGAQAVKARSKEFRDDAAEMLLHITRVGNKAPRGTEFTLTEDENVACKEIALKLTTAPDKDLRHKGLEILSYVGDTGCQKAITKLLADRETDNAQLACLLLGKIGDTSSVPALVKVIESAASSRVRRQAIESLGRIGGKQAKAALEKLARNPKQSYREDINKALDLIESSSAER